jgi:hypothetical protein
MSRASHLARVRSVSCVVCSEMGMEQVGPTAAHHLESVRDEVSDYATAALCHEHHQGATGVHELGRRGFERRYKLTPIDLLALTVRALQR